MPSYAGNSVQGAKGAAMATAFVAVSDDPSAMSWNPAGLTQLDGNNAYVGLTATTLSSAYKASAGGSEETDFQMFYAPHIYLSSATGIKNTYIGMGISSPFGIGGRKWDRQGLTRYSSVESSIATLAANPAVAYKVSPMLSAAVGADYMVSRSEAKYMVDQSLVGAEDGEIACEADGDGWGYNAGLLFMLNERFRAGLAYRSGIKVDYSGDIKYENIAPALQPLFGGQDYKTSVTTSLRFPEIWVLGIAYKTTEKLTVAVDLERDRWSSFDKAYLDIKSEVPAAGFTDSTSVMDWKDVWVLMLGVDYSVSDEWSLRGGYSYAETAVPEKTLDAGNPDSNLNYFSIGAGYKREGLTVDIYYALALYQDRKIDNRNSSGEYENTGHSMGISAGFMF